MQILREARLRIGSADEAPGPEAVGWERVHLPDLWTLRRRMRGVVGDYELGVRVPARARGSEPLAIFVPSVRGHLDLFWNGERLGDSGASAGLGPVLVAVPDALVRAGANRLLIRFETDAGTQAQLREIVVGPLSSLRDAYRQKQLTLVQLPVAFAVGGVLAAFYLMVAYRRDAGALTVRLLSFGLITCSLSLLSGFLSSAILPARLAGALPSILLFGGFALFTVALERVRTLVRVRTQRFLVAQWVVFSALSIAVPPLYRPAVAVLWTALNVFICAYMAWMLVRIAREGEPRPRTLALAPIVLIGAFLLHDVTGVARGHFLADQPLTIYLPPAITFTLLAFFLARAREALDESQRLQGELEARVEAKGRALAENYEKLRAIERRQTIADERERLLAEMHDGLGGQLVSTLAMVEGGRFEPGEVAEALRDSLDDLRLMVESLDPGESDLAAMLGMLRERLEPRLARQGLRFEWRVNDVPELPGLGADGLLHVMRIVQEVITNVVKHAHASTIQLETGFEPARADREGGIVTLRISDDGVGLPEAPRPGRGLANMRRRAKRLGAEIEIVSRAEAPGEGPSGTSVLLRLPTHGATEAEAPR